MNVAVRKEWAGKNEATVAAYIRALRKAESFVAKNTGAAQALVATEINLDADIVKSIWSQYEFGFGLDKAALLKVVTDEGQWIKRTQPGFENKEVPDYAGYFDERFVR
jgi:ABC-type nitrate/sulfonate/bicarbonate transport system substrate-binding protein